MDPVYSNVPGVKVIDKPDAARKEFTVLMTKQFLEMVGADVRNPNPNSHRRLTPNPTLRITLPLIITLTLTRT